MYAGAPSTAADEACFLTEKLCLMDLVKGLETSCPCGKSSSPWDISSVVQVMRIFL